MPIDPLALPNTPSRKATKGKKKKDACHDCGESLRIGKNERVEGARKRLCPVCFEKFAAGFFR